MYMYMHNIALVEERQIVSESECIVYDANVRLDGFLYQ